MRARLYGIPMSHPVITARLALARKGVEVQERTLLAGAHPLLLLALGFRGGTVPALRLDGARVQGSTAITRALEAAVPDPPLYPGGPAERAAVAEAEAWGERVLQPIPRRLIRRTLVLSGTQRRWFAATTMPLPFPGLVALALRPIAGVFAGMVGSSAESTAADLASLDEILGHVDALIADGVIGGPDLNAADCQIAPAVRMLLAFADLHDRVAAHGPAAALALRLVPDYPGIPGVLGV
ncbi:glutathione S-transferase N-terminal domain-containing protein [Paraconexibacter antarcticus]|uniref:Glutathione S-transferase N-terminal domain-containing protein n=1 Tax=Paraconexibacter antarcticus TaxID=2949664 RepID=A0ABY5DZ43_9ACTN|nr:glutathione S-transferase N-terminal domain-containing protein [Paraconexibacter antarcticus]UTI65907.1 glutathione S-transferase N-terminal domain-containing protein [Paraconexibacter antarcticus]